MLKCAAGTVDLGGDDALVEAFNTGGFDFIATDDKRLIRRLRNLGIGCVVPGLILHHLVDKGRLGRSEGLRMLEVLSRSISSDEYQIARFLLRGDG